MGLNPGNNFHKWMKTLLAEKGILTLADLKRVRAEAPKGGLFNRLTREPYRNYERICIIAADITTETKAIFPEMADLYWKEPDQVNPADFVRASMSIPLFYQPFRVKNIPQPENAYEIWKTRSGYEGNVPAEVLFVDGGTMSNFPIDVFHDHYHVPQAPTFGAKLGLDRTQPQKTDRFPQLLEAVFDASRHVHDYDFIMRNPDYQHLVCYIDTDAHKWLDFDLSDEAKLDLFIRGAQAASEFLYQFDWEAYKKLREAAAGVYMQCQVMCERKPPVVRELL